MLYNYSVRFRIIQSNTTKNIILFCNFLKIAEQGKAITLVIS